MLIEAADRFFAATDATFGHDVDRDFYAPAAEPLHAKRAIACLSNSGQSAPHRRSNPLTTPGRPATSNSATGAAVCASSLPRRYTLSRVARSRIASTASFACSSTKSAWQPGAIP